MSVTDNPRVVYGGGFYLVGWLDAHTNPFTHPFPNLLIARVASATGVVQEPGGINVQTNIFFYPWAYDLAYAAPNFFVVYGFSQLLSSRVSAATGQIVDTVPLTTNVPNTPCGNNPTLVSNGDGILVSYLSAGCAGVDTTLQNPIAATRVANDGTDLDPIDFQLGAVLALDLPLDKRHTSVVLSRSPSSGQILMAYDRFDGTPNLVTYRAQLRAISIGGGSDAGMPDTGTIMTDGGAAPGDAAIDRAMVDVDAGSVVDSAGGIDDAGAVGVDAGAVLDAAGAGDAPGDTGTVVSDGSAPSDVADTAPADTRIDTGVVLDGAGPPPMDAGPIVKDGGSSRDALVDRMALDGGGEAPHPGGGGCQCDVDGRPASSAGSWLIFALLPLLCVLRSRRKKT